MFLETHVLSLFENGIAQSAEQTSYFISLILMITQLLNSQEPTNLCEALKRNVGVRVIQLSLEQLTNNTKLL